MRKKRSNNLSPKQFREIQTSCNINLFSNLKKACYLQFLQKPCLNTKRVLALFMWEMLKSKLL